MVDLLNGASQGVQGRWTQVSGVNQNWVMGVNQVVKWGACSKYMYAVVGNVMHIQEYKVSDVQQYSMPYFLKI